jgi:hypothetical protein
VAFFLLLAAATEIVFPVAIIILGLLLLLNNLRGRRHRSPSAVRITAPPSSPEVELSPPAEPAKPDRVRPPTLEEQIEAAISEDADETKDAQAEEPEPPADMPAAPEMPEPPEVPQGPDVG